MANIKPFKGITRKKFKIAIFADQTQANLISSVIFDPTIGLARKIDAKTVNIDFFDGPYDIEYAKLIKALFRIAISDSKHPNQDNDIHPAIIDALKEMDVDEDFKKAAMKFIPKLKPIDNYKNIKIVVFPYYFDSCLGNRRIRNIIRLAIKSVVNRGIFVLTPVLGMTEKAKEEFGYGLNFLSQVEGTISMGSIFQGENDFAPRLTSYTSLEGAQFFAPGEDKDKTGKRKGIVAIDLNKEKYIYSGHHAGTLALTTAIVARCLAIKPDFRPSEFLDLINRGSQKITYKFRKNMITKGIINSGYLESKLYE